MSGIGLPWFPVGVVPTTTEPIRLAETPRFQITVEERIGRVNWLLVGAVFLIAILLLRKR